MATRLHRRAIAPAGFTLIELMVTVLIVSVLATIAISSYSTSVRHSRRAEAKTALLDLAAREERYFSTNSTYSNDAGNLGFSTSSQTLFQVNVGNNYYQVNACTGSAIPTACSSAQAVGPGATFLLVATAVNGQVKDTTCATFTVDNTGVQSSTNSSGTATSGCW